MHRLHHTDKNTGKGCGHGARSGHGHRGFGGGRARRGDIREAILRLLSEEPMHGYQIIKELSARSEGAWSPSAGSVYPTLALLADEGLIVEQLSGDKKVFSLTEEGAQTFATVADNPAPWDQATRGGVDAVSYHKSTGKLMQALFQIGKTGSSTQIGNAIVVIDETRKKLYSILAED